MYFVKDMNENWYEYNPLVNKFYVYSFWGNRVEYDERYFTPPMYCGSWYELSLTVGFNPLLGCVLDNDVWLSPFGEYYKVDCFIVAARNIVKLIYGDKIYINDYYSKAADILLTLGWMKLSVDYYKYNIKNTEYWKPNQKQRKAIKDWRIAHNIPLEDDYE